MISRVWTSGSLAYRWDFGNRETQLQSSSHSGEIDREIHRGGRGNGSERHSLNRKRVTASCPGERPVGIPLASLGMLFLLRGCFHAAIFTIFLHGACLGVGSMAAVLTMWNWTLVNKV